MSRVGEMSRDRGLVTRGAVFEFFTANICATNLDCAAALGVSKETVGRHARAIRKGWRPALNYRDDALDCPVCMGGPITRVTVIRQGVDHELEAASCFSCGNTGPAHDDMDTAVRAWNALDRVDE